jgi:nitrilase
VTRVEDVIVLCHLGVPRLEIDDWSLTIEGLMLICGENTNPLARFALMAQGEQVHMSSYPPIWPTRPASEKGGYDLCRAIQTRAGSHAFEAKMFNVVSSGRVEATLRQALAGLDKSALDTLENAPRAISMIIDPTGEVASEVIAGEEGITYAEIDVARCVEQKQFHDVVG